MEINNFERLCQLHLSRHAYFENCFVLARTDIEVLIKRYEYLKGMVESSCSEDDLKKSMMCNGFLKSIIENSTQDNQKLEEKIAALNEVITQTRKQNEILLEEAHKQRKRNDSEELARKLVECQIENKMLTSEVSALGQEKAQLKAMASFWQQKGSELSGRYDQQASVIVDIVKDVSVVKQQMTRVMELAEDYPAPEKHVESPCKDIRGVFSTAMNDIYQFESSVNEQMRGFQHDIDQIAQTNSSLKTKCRSLEQELKMVSEEKASLEERLASKSNVEGELSALRERCECSENQLADAEASRIAHEKSLAKQVELDGKLKTAEAQVKQLLEELQEERSRLSEQIAAIEEKNKLLDKAKQENVTMQQKNARQVETFQETINKLERLVKSVQSDLEATEENLTARQHEIVQLVHSLEKRNEVIRHLEEEMVSLNVERDQNLDTISLLKNKIKEMSGFDKDLESKVEHIEYLHQEVEQLEKEREQIMLINDDVAGEIKEWQAMIECLCLMINDVKDSLTDQTIEKENMIAKDAVPSTTPRLQVFFSSRELQSSVSVFSEIKGRVSEIPADAKQFEDLTGPSQTSRMSAVTRTEQSRQVCVCIGDDSVVTSAMNMVEDIKAHLRAYVQEETKKRNQELVTMFRAQKTKSELNGKCEELDKTSLELKIVKNKYISVKKELRKQKQQNLSLIEDQSIAEDTMTRIVHEMNESGSKISTLERDVKKGLDTIRKQYDTIKVLENTINELRKMLHEHSVTTKNESESSGRIQEKSCTQVNMGIPPPENTNKDQSSAEIAQDTEDHIQSGSNLVEDGSYRYEKISDELEVKLEIMERSHHKEVDNLNRVHVENMISLKKVFERERTKDREMYEELVGKQQEMHEEQINELNLLHDSEISFLWSNKRRERSNEETQTPEDWTVTLAAGGEVIPAQENCSTDPLAAKERILLIEKNSFDVRIRVLSQQHAKELDSLKTEHARKLADIADELKKSLAEEEAGLEKQFQALRGGNELELLRLKTRYCSEMKHENEKFNLSRREVLVYARKALSISNMEVMEIKPYSGSRRAMAVARSDTSHVMSSGSVELNDFRQQKLRCPVHSDSDVLAAEQLEALHNMVCPTSCLAPYPRWSSSQSLQRSQSDFSNDQSDQNEEFNLRDCNTESNEECCLMNLMKHFELINNTVGKTQRMILSLTAKQQ